MPNSEIEAKLRDLTQGFVRDLLQAFRETFAAVVGGDEMPNGRASAPARGRKGQGGRRSPEETAQLAKRVAAYVNSQSKGVRVDAIGKQLGMTTAELMLPIAKALSARSITRTGQRRATTYLPAKK
jgi:hypothetical protein